MILYLDTETSGLRPGQVCQLSYVMQTQTETIAKNKFFSVDNVEYGALCVHGFSVEKLKVLSQGKIFSDHALEIYQDLAKADIVVAHNTSFDMMFLRSEFEKLNLELPVQNSFCSMKNTTAVCKLKGRKEGYKYPKLSELIAYFGITDYEILNVAKSLFGCSCGYHDARFDTTALYLAMNKGMNCEPMLAKLKEYL